MLIFRVLIQAIALLSCIYKRELATQNFVFATSKTNNLHKQRDGMHNIYGPRSGLYDRLTKNLQTRNEAWKNSSSFSNTLRTGTIQLIVNDTLVATHQVSLPLANKGQVYSAYVSSRGISKIGPLTFTVKKVESTSYCIGVEASNDYKTRKYRRISTLIYPQVLGEGKQTINAAIERRYLASKPSLFFLLSGEKIAKAEYEQAGFDEQSNQPGNKAIIRKIAISCVNQKAKFVSFYNEELEYHNPNRNDDDNCPDSLYVGTLHYNLATQQFISTSELLKTTFKDELSIFATKYLIKKLQINTIEQQFLKSVLKEPQKISYDTGLGKEMTVKYCPFYINNNLALDIKFTISPELAALSLID